MNSNWPPLICPPALKKGARIRLVAPARKISPAELAPALKIIAAWGWEATWSEALWASDHQLAGDDATRLADLQEALDDPSIEAIFCVRGGYGSVRLVDQLQWEAFLRKPKWLVGYSDITVLHQRVQQCGVMSLHASMPINFADNSSASLQSLRQALAGDCPPIPLTPHPLNRPGRAEGRLCGGNLSMLYSQCGSPTALRTEGAILFFEDLDEYLYHIDRMMWNLKRNGYFERPAAVVVGSMSAMNDNRIPWGESAEEIIARHLSHYPYPLAFGLPAGHLADNRSLRFGAPAQLEISTQGGQLKFL